MKTLVTCKKKPTDGAIYQGYLISGEMVYLVDDGEAPAFEVEAGDIHSPSNETLAPERFDLPVGHPLRGKRALRVVPSGSRDIVVSETGELELWTPGVEVIE